MNADVQRIDKASIRMDRKGFLHNIKKYKLQYVLIIPGLLYFILFHYGPMIGIVIAFKEVSPFEGISGILHGEWMGLYHFRKFFSSIYFWNIIGNTVTISFYKIAFGFPAPIVLALLLNEVRQVRLKKVIQTISYLPHFISMVVLAGLLTNILAMDGGIVNEVIKLSGGKPVYFLGDKNYFRSVLVISDIWSHIGWGSIIYLAAISGIDEQQYEAAMMDGAGKLRQVWSITLPGMVNIIVIMFIFRVGALLNAGFEQIFNLYSPAVYEVADIIDTYVYRVGIQQMQYSFSAAVGFFKSLVALVLILGTNYLAKKLDQEGIW